ncbi:MAG: type II secretion system major pseudopilin GspG [Pseudomonadales bacterium]
MRNRERREAGFTLLEIMVVIVILGLLVALVAPSVLGNQDKAMVQKARADIAALGSALKMYKLDNFRYPTTEQGLQALVSAPSIGPKAKNYRQEGYIDALANDPWGGPYQYRYPAANGKFAVYSLGADGTEGGEGYDADIGRP